MKTSGIFLFAVVFVAGSLATTFKLRDGYNETQVRMAMFRISLDEFFEKFEKKTIFDDQDGSIKNPANKILSCVLGGGASQKFLPDIKNLISDFHKAVYAEKTDADLRKEFCKANKTNTVIANLKRCLGPPTIKKKDEKMQFVRDLRDLVGRLENEFCFPEQIKERLEVFLRFQEEMERSTNSPKAFKNAFKRFEELKKDCNKLKKSDYCLPLKIVDAFEVSALQSQAFSPYSLKLYVDLVQIYYTTSIKAPYSNRHSQKCHREKFNKDN